MPAPGLVLPGAGSLTCGRPWCGRQTGYRRLQATRAAPLFRQVGVDQGTSECRLFRGSVLFFKGPGNPSLTSAVPACALVGSARAQRPGACAGGAGTASEPENPVRSALGPKRLVVASSGPAGPREGRAVVRGDGRSGLGVSPHTFHRKFSDFSRPVWLA